MSAASTLFGIPNCDTVKKARAWLAANGRELQFRGNDSWESLGIRGDESFDILLADEIAPQQEATLVIHRDGVAQKVALTLRIDTPIEVDYYKHGGILPFVLRQLLAA